METLELPPRGVIQSHTTLRMPPEGFKAPLSMALVELEQGALILCLGSEQSSLPINIGDTVDIELDSQERFCFRVVS